MGLHKEAYFVFVETIFFSFLLLYESRKLDGYEFPVFSTKFCPRNQTEWDERSSAINCTESNGYLCLPNKELTELLEFCYLYPFIWMQEDLCFTLYKPFSRVTSYNCSRFKSGCPSSSHISSKSFEYQNCVAIQNGCFIAEPSCSSTPTSPVEITEYENISSDLISTISDIDTTETNHIENVTINNSDWIFQVSAVLFIIVCAVSMLVIYCRKGRAYTRNFNEEDGANDEVSLLKQKNHLDEIETVKKGQIYSRTNHLDDISNDEPLVNNIKPCQRDEVDSIQKRDTCYSSQESPLDRAIFDHWQQDSNMFIPTKAYEEVKNLIKKQNLVIVVGHSGSGKSAIIQHIALEYRSRSWVVKSVKEVKDIVIAFSNNNVPENQTLFVLNDPIGKESFDEKAYTSWKKHEEHLEACLKKTKLLLSCRKCVYYDKRVRGLIQYKSNIVDIDADLNKLNNDEKQQILNKYKSDDICFSETEITQIFKIEAYFPLLCRLYFNDKENLKNGLRFFKQPVKVLEEEIRTFRNLCKEKYCALILLVLFNNAFCVSDLLKDNISKKVYRDALELCGMRKETAPYTICDTLETLKGFYVTKIGDTYQFCHDFVMEVTSYVFGTDYPANMIEYVDIGFLRKRVRLNTGTCDKQNDELTIYLSDKHIYNLAERLFTEIFGENFMDVVLNPCLKNRKIVELFIAKMKHHPNKIKILLTEKKLHLEEQLFHRAPKEFSFSKLDFVSGEKSRISPLCALIIFCHTDTYLYSLEALKLMPKIFQDYSLFSAVCCNGAKDLFNMFPKRDIDFYLEERWGRFYPIHIVSVFHNNEILQELIQLGVNVNVKMCCGWRPLLLAIANYCEENEDHNIIIPMNTRRYKTIKLLVLNGAKINKCQKNGASPLYIASLQGDENIIKLLLNNGADINLCEENGASPLYIACENGHDSTVQCLLLNKADVNLCTKYETSPLYIACEKGYHSIVQTLLCKGADINLCNKNSASPLFIACENGQDIVVQVLLRNSANTNICLEDGASPLYMACQKGHDNIVEMLLRNGADINLCKKDGASPIFVACQNRHNDTVQILLKHGANINECTVDGASPLYIACKNGHDSTVQLLLTTGANINSFKKNGEGPIHIACEKGHDDVLKLLLGTKADTNLITKDGTSPLFLACRAGHKNTMQLLLSNGADPNLYLDGGVSALHCACCNGNDTIVQLLLSHGALINLSTDCGISPLWCACFRGHDNIVELLLRRGADINLYFHGEISALHAASEYGHVEIVQRLLKYETNVNSCTDLGISPLYSACLNGHGSIVKLLLKSGADINLFRISFIRPVYAAFFMKHYEIIKMLLDENADTSFVIKRCRFNICFTDWYEHGDITGQYLLRKGNILDNIFDLDSYFSLFIFCQFEEFTRIQNRLNKHLHG